MKTVLFLSVLLFSQLHAAEDSFKPLYKVEAKKHLLESNTGRSFGGDSKAKDYTLRVTITNVSRGIVNESKLSGEVLVQRAVGEKEKLVKESLAPVTVPALKPNEQKTIDLGKVTVRKVEWRHKEFEESMEEWKVLCKQGEKEIGGYQSCADFTKLSEDAHEVEAGTMPDKLFERQKRIHQRLKR